MVVDAFGPFPRAGEGTERAEVRQRVRVGVGLGVDVGFEG
jgi:hypothetical protein